jgi:8-oxo-dGTP diphosphatase
MSKPFKLAVKAVILDQGKRCLLVRRSAANRNFVGFWEWPGGKVDPGEDFATALHREVREECGLEIEFTGLAGASEFEMPAARVVLICLTARLAGGELRLSHEHNASDWVQLEELAQRQILEQMKPALKSLLERKESYV